MSITATTSNKEFQQAPKGNHIARIFSIVHEGVIPTTYMGEPKMTDTVRIGFELPNESMEDGRPFSVYQEYTLSMHEKAKLRHLVEGILGQGLLDQDALSFEVTDLMGRVCMLNVIHNDKGYPRIVGAAPLPKGVEAPDQINPPFILDFNDNWTNEKFEKQPQFIKDKIMSSTNYQRKFSEKGAEPFDKNIELTPVSEMDWDGVDPESIPF